MRLIGLMELMRLIGLMELIGLCMQEGFFRNSAYTANHTRNRSFRCPWLRADSH